MQSMLLLVDKGQQLESAHKYCNSHWMLTYLAGLVNPSLSSRGCVILLYMDTWSSAVSPQLTSNPNCVEYWNLGDKWVRSCYLIVKWQNTTTFVLRQSISVLSNCEIKFHSVCCHNLENEDTINFSFRWWRGWLFMKC